MRCADPAAAREPLLRRCDPAAKLAVFLLLVLVLALAQPAWVFAAAVLLLLLLARLGRQLLRRLLRPLLRLNPLYYCITAYQNFMIYGQLPSWDILLVIVLLSLGIFLLGYWFFEKMKQLFDDNI